MCNILNSSIPFSNFGFKSFESGLVELMKQVDLKWAEDCQGFNSAS